MPRAHNAAGTAPTAGSLYQGSEFAVFDRLPVTVRRALHEALLPWDARAVKAYTETAGARETVKAIRDADKDEITAFGRTLPGGMSPHQKADATMLRYKSARTLR